MKSLFSIVLASTMIIVGFSSSSLAGHHHDCDGKKCGNLSDIDTDNDGMISMDEFMEAKKEKYQAWFNKLDANGDGVLSQEEWDAKRKGHKCGEKSEG
jgi:hypothetical protein